MIHLREGMSKSLNTRILCRLLVTVLLVVLGNLAIGSTGDPLPIVPPKRRALVIGVSNYASLGKLGYAASDARKVREALLERFRFTPENLKFLSDEAGAQSEAPTIANVQEALDNLLKDPLLQKGDLFLLYFSGHGIGLPSGDYLCPSDAKLENVEKVGIPVRKVVERFVQAGLKNVLIIADACRSGTENPFGEELLALSRKANIGVLLGCKPGGRSYENERVGGGVFTWSFLRSIQDEKVRTDFGALWASAVADQTSRRAKAFTERDYPSDPQVPTAWTDPTRDVLIGAFPPKDRSDLSKVLDEAGKSLQPESYHATVKEFAATLESQGRNQECLELLKSLEGSGLADTADRFLLAGVAIALGRSTEASRTLRAIVNSDAPELDRIMALMLDPLPNVDVQERIKASFRLIDLFEEGADRADGAFLAWFTISSWGDEKDLVKLWQKVGAGLNDRPKMQAFLHAETLMAEGKFDEARPAYERAMEGKDDVIETSWVALRSFECIVRSLVDAPRDEALDRVAKILREQGEGEGWGTWQSMRAVWYRSFVGPEPAEKLALALSKEPDLAGYSILRLIEAAPTRLKEMAPEFRRLAKARPYDWRAQLAAGLAMVLSGDPALNADPAALEYLQAAEKGTDDVFESTFAGLMATHHVVSEYVGRGLIPLETYAQQALSNWRSLLPYLRERTLAPSAWFDVLSFGITAQRQLQVSQLWKDVADRNPSGADLLTVLYQTAIGMDDRKEAERIIHSPNLLDPDKTILQWNWVAHLIAWNRITEAKAFAKDLGEPVPAYADQARVLRLVLANIEGTKETENKRAIELENALAKTVAKRDFLQRAVLGLVLARMNRWQVAAEALQESALYQDYRLLGIQVVGATLLINRLWQEGETKAADSYLLGLTTTLMETPHYLHLGFSPTPSLKDYEGRASGKGDYMTDNPPREGVAGVDGVIMAGEAGKATATIEIDSKGAATLQLTRNGVTETFTGSVDKLGNLRAQSKSETGVSTLFAKLPPWRLAKDPAMKTTKWTIFTYDAKGLRTDWRIFFEQG